MTTNIYEIKNVLLQGRDADGKEVTMPGFMDADGVYTESGHKLDGEFIYDCRYYHVAYNGEPVTYDGSAVSIERVFLEVLPGRFPQ